MVTGSTGEDKFQSSSWLHMSTSTFTLARGQPAGLTVAHTPSETLREDVVLKKGLDSLNAALLTARQEVAAHLTNAEEAAARAKEQRQSSSRASTKLLLSSSLPSPPAPLPFPSPTLSPTATLPFMPPEDCPWKDSNKAERRGVGWGGEGDVTWRDLHFHWRAPKNRETLEITSMERVSGFLTSRMTQRCVCVGGGGVGPPVNRAACTSVCVCVCVTHT
jgi:hypothetical protein